MFTSLGEHYGCGRVQRDAVWMSSASDHPRYASANPRGGKDLRFRCLDPRVPVRKKFPMSSLRACGTSTCFPREWQI